MATKKRTRKKQPEPSTLEQVVEGITRADVAGAVLILISVFTLLSLLTGSRGSITGAWIDALETAFGFGAWAFPLVTGVLGLWLVIRAIDRVPDMSWQRPVGIALLFIAFVTGAALAVQTADSDAGGWLGTQLAVQLEGAITMGGAWAMVTFVAIAGIVFLADRLLVETGLGIWDLVLDWRYRREAPTMPPIQPGAPLPSGAIPLHKRLRENIENILSRFRSAPQTQPIFSSERRTQKDDVEARRTRDTVETTDSSTAAAGPAASDTLLTPRIIGDIVEAPQEWRLPQLEEMLGDWDRTLDNDNTIRLQGHRIQETLEAHGVPVDFEGAFKGPRVTQYLIKPGYIERTVRGERKRVKVKVSKITALANDLALALAAQTVRIEAPIPGTNYVGVEVPNQESNVVGLKDLLKSDEYTGKSGNLLIALGEDVKGQPIIADLARMPHLLIAGATGSGKSFCINSILASLLLKHTPDTLRLLLIDPKMVELSIYNSIPHLLAPVVTDVDKASGILFWAVKEMERRYSLLSKVNARDLGRYNAYLEKRGEKRLPYIVVVVDEMADLMMAAPEEVEKHICRLAQMARAVGIHLIIATQRPSVDVITGLIKANFPARIAFAVTSGTDSRVILDIPGAERLLGAGDMLFMAPDASKLERLQGTFLTDDEISRLVRYWKGVRSFEEGPKSIAAGELAIDYAKDPLAAEDGGPDIGDPGPLEIQPPTSAEDLSQAPLFEEIEAMKSVDARDELYDDAVRVVAEAGRGSVTLLQRKLRIGYSRASRLVEQLEEAGMIGPDQGGNQGRKYLGANAPEADAAAENRPPILGDEADNQGATQVWF